jgi:hypothetical protein
MTTAILDLPASAPETPPTRGDASRFWTLQAVAWSAYAAALMVPWLDRYSVVVMIPNKIVIAVTGILLTSALRLVYRGAMRRSVPVERLLGLAIGGSAVAGTLWSAILVSLLGSSVGHQLARLGSLEAGVPAFAGAPYHALVVLVWSLAYVSVAALRGSRDARHGHGPALERVPAKRRPAVTPAGLGASVAPDEAERPRELLARDGKRTVVLDVDEVDWIEADGDYVRVHRHGKPLLLRDTMSRLESALATDFLRIHRSAIVNVSRVSEVVSLPNRELAVTLRSGAHLRASRTYAERLRAALGMEP